jgi:hypothetical protein
VSFVRHSQPICSITGTLCRYVGYPTVPSFYFHVDGPPNELEVDLPDLATAKCESVRYAGRLLCDQASEFWDHGDFVMTVTDDQGLTLFTLHFNAYEAPAIRAGR